MYIEAEDAVAVAMMIQDLPMVDIVSLHREVHTVLISIHISIHIKCTKRRESMKLPILTEAQTLGVKHPIAKGIHRKFQLKIYFFFSPIYKATI